MVQMHKKANFQVTRKKRSSRKLVIKGSLLSNYLQYLLKIIQYHHNRENIAKSKTDISSFTQQTLSEAIMQGFSYIKKYVVC